VRLRLTRRAVVAFGAMPVANLTNIALSADLTTGLALKADLASPTLTGVPAAPTAALGVSTTQLATTAYVVGMDGLVVRVLEDAAAAILESTKLLYLVSSAAGSKTITQTSTRPHQHLRIVLAAASGGDYLLLEASGITGGDLTFNASGEYADLYRNAADDAWDVVLTGATIV
jgi:hypothetical protein